MYKAAFLDRDGTINIDFGYISTIDRWEFAEGAIDAIKSLNDNNYLVIVITNQSGIARGYFTQRDIDDLHVYINEQLKKYEAHIDAFYCCPHHKDGIVAEYTTECNCRKPSTGLYEQAIADFKIDVSRSLACGDKDSDTKAAKNVNVSKIGQIGKDCESLFDFVSKVIGA